MDSMTTLTINLDVLHENIQEILSFKEGDFLFVLKSNAYGFGYREILAQLEPYDKIQFIGVALPNEALYVRPHTTKKVVVLGYTPDEMLRELCDQQIIPSIFERHQATVLPNNAEVFINIDTGFHRLGCSKEVFHELLSCSNLNVVGVFTHLRLMGSKEDLLQVELFDDIIRDTTIPYRSISDSIGYTRYQLKENLYRIGAAMFGYTSIKEVGKLKLQEVAHLKTIVTRVETINEDTRAFYRTTLHKGQQVATIQIGYGDGLFRTMPQDSYILVNGCKCRYIEVGMDQSLIDVTDCHVRQGDAVTIFGEEGMSLQEYADALDINKNNVLTMIQHRVVREYIKHGTIIKRTGLLEEKYES
jgi:alanine racemase